MQKQGEGNNRIMNNANIKELKKELNAYIKKWDNEISLTNYALEKLCRDYASSLYKHGEISKSQIVLKASNLKDKYLKSYDEYINMPDLCKEMFNGRRYQELNVIDRLFENIIRSKEDPANKYVYMNNSYCINTKRTLYKYIKQLVEFRKENKVLKVENNQLKDELSTPIKLRSENMKLQEENARLKEKLKKKGKTL